MNINIKGTHMELTPAISEYVTKKVSMLEKFLKGKADQATLQVEVGKTSTHHKNGDVFRAEINLSIPGQVFRTEVERHDLYVAIDQAKEEMVERLSASFGKKENLFRQGARKLKKLLRRE